MTQTVKLTQSIDDREVLRAFQKQNAALDKIVNKLDTVGRKGGGAGKKTAAGMKDATGELGKLAAGIVGVGSVVGGLTAAVAAIKSEYEDLVRRQQQAALVTQTAAEAVRGARINFTPDATLKDNQLEATIQQVAQETRSPVGIVGGAISNAFSAKGSLSNQEAVDAVRQSLRLTPGDAGSATTFAGRILDVAKVSEVKDAKAIAGFLTNVQASSRVTTVDKVGKTAVPAIAALTGRGDTPEQAAEIFAAITQGIADEEGNTSATAAKNLGTRLGLFVPTTSGKDKRGKFEIPQAQLDRFGAAGSTSERIDVLQQSPELARQFLGSTSFDAASQGFIEKLVTGEAGAVRELETARRNIQAITPAQAGKFEQKVAGLDRGKFQGVLTSEQSSQANIEDHQLGSSGGAIGQSRKILDDTLQQVDLPGIDAIQRRRLNFSFEQSVAAGNSPGRAAAGVLKLQLPGSDVNSPLNLFKGQASDEVNALFQKQIEVLTKLEKSIQERANQPQKVEVVNPGAAGERREPAAAANNRGGNR